jgi:pimeloyl-ACP methyl ester carboxylesterase
MKETKVAFGGITFFILFASSFYLCAQTDSGKVFTSFDNSKIYYEVKGQGIPVVLIHGFSNTGNSWKSTEIYNQLLQAGFKVVTPDLRGNGRSDKPHTPEAYENDAEAKDIMALMNLLQCKAYHVIGYSRGAIIASRLIVLDDKVSKAVLGGMGADFTNPQWPRRIMFYKALIGEPVPELESFLKHVKEKNLDQLALAYQQKAQPSTSPAELALIKKPVMVISGDTDQDNGSGKKLSEMIPGSIFVTVPGNHNNTSKSNDFAKSVIGFLK